MAKQTITQLLVQEHSEEIRHLYLEQMLTERELARHFGISRHPIRDAMSILGIPRRSGRGVTYLHPERKPTKEQLNQWLNEDLETLQSIAIKLECDPSTVRNWAIEYNLDWSKTPWRRTMSRVKPIQFTCEQLEDLYLKRELSQKQIADLFGCSRIVIKHRLKKYNIPARKSGWKSTRFKCKDGHQVRSTYEQRVDDWLFNHGLLHSYEPPLPFDPYLSADFLVGETYIEIWGVYDNAAYKERKARKRKLYDQYDVCLIQISYTDFATKAHARWQRKLQGLLLKST